MVGRLCWCGIVGILLWSCCWLGFCCRGCWVVCSVRRLFSFCLLFGFGVVGRNIGWFCVWCGLFCVVRVLEVVCFFWWSRGCFFVVCLDSVLWIVFCFCCWCVGWFVRGYWFGVGLVFCVFFVVVVFFLWKLGRDVCSGWYCSLLGCGRSWVGFLLCWFCSVFCIVWCIVWWILGNWWLNWYWFRCGIGSCFWRNCCVCSRCGWLLVFVCIGCFFLLGRWCRDWSWLWFCRLGLFGYVCSFFLYWGSVCCRISGYSWLVCLLRCRCLLFVWWWLFWFGLDRYLGYSVWWFCWFFGCIVGLVWRFILSWWWWVGVCLCDEFFLE